MNEGTLDSEKCLKSVLKNTSTGRLLIFVSALLNESNKVSSILRIKSFISLSVFSKYFLYLYSL